MAFFKMFFSKIGHIFLSIVGAFRRALCCFRRRRRSSDSSQLVTSLHVTSSVATSKLENSDLQDWEVWNEDDVPTGITVELNKNSGVCRTDGSMQEFREESDVNFFEDMTPSIRRPKTYIVKGGERNETKENSSENSFTFNVQAPSFHNPELGYIEDHTGSWEDISPEDMWNPEVVFREQKLAEREKRIAEHQRRKKEKEARRNGKQSSFSPNHS